MADDTSPSNYFRKMWAAGYRDLLPIVPPGAPISPNSTLAKRPQAVGKVPGVRGLDGRWSSYPWLTRETEESDLDRWHDMGAGVGVKGACAPGLDFDVLDETVCAALQEVAERMLGETGVRVGRAPKVLLPYRSDEPLRWRRIAFTLPGDDRPQGVELIGIDRQWVAVGVHPGTGQPYHWRKPLRPYAGLPLLTTEAVDAFFAEAQRLLLETGATLQTVIGTTAVDRAAIDQEALRGPLAAVQAAVQAIPNTNETFPTRGEYLLMALAIKAALPDHPGEAEELWVDWAMRWEGNEANPAGNDEDIVRADWSRCHPPFSLGANWIFEKARPHGFNDAALDFQPIDTDYDPWARPAPELPNIHWVNPADYEGVPVPERKWVVEGWIPAGVVTAIYGDGGIGKTLLSQQLATCVAAGLPWLGLPTTQGRVMCLYCEDSADEIHIRQVAICERYLLEPKRLADGLRLSSRDNADNTLAVFDAQGVLQLTPLWRSLRDSAMAFGASLVIVDTAADTFGGDEIKRAQVRQFIQGCVGRLAKEIGGSVVLLAHPSAAGISSGKGTGGSTAWNNSVRSRLYLQHADEENPSDFRRLTKMKSNYGKAGDAFLLKWDAGTFTVRAGPAGNTTSDSIDDMRERVFLAAFDDLTGQKETLNVSRTSPHYAPKVIKRLRPETVEGLQVAELEAAMDRLIQRRLLVADGKALARPAVDIFG